jgi:small-conductance mechanosensitive channel
MPTFNSISEQMTPFLLEHGVKILFIVIATYILQRFGLSFINRLIRKVVSSNAHASDLAKAKREDTLIRIFATSLKIVLWLVAGLMILQELGVAIGPILAAAGVAGIALGFGGQYLIRDLISGLFIILENQYRIGDVVCFEDTCGLVEDITLRMTTLRNLDGTVHHVPHGEVTKVSNLSKQFARVNLDVGVAYESNLEQVIKVVNEVGMELTSDPEWSDKIIAAPQFLRVENFAESAMVIKILGDTRPLAQWEVTGELRKRLKIAFDKNGITIPYPQRVVHTPK